MADKKNKKKQLIEDFKALENKAKELYPDIEKTVSLANNMTAILIEFVTNINATKV
jgi:putative methionine-R-sulfoxide reductase with GAF domain